MNEDGENKQTATGDASSARSSVTWSGAFARLSKSTFRSRFRLTEAERRYVAEKGMETICRHAEDFVRMKLAPAWPENDGKQTPMRGHPIFKAMHGCAMCCRGCMEKWWKMPRGVALTEDQQRKIIDFLVEWVRRQCKAGGSEEERAPSRQTPV